MITKKNYNIVSLYVTVFIIIALITAYLPLWLKSYLYFENSEVGFVLASVGVLKFFSNFIITRKVQNINNLRNTMIAIIISIIIVFIIISFFQTFINKQINLILVLISLLVFSPVIPMVETIFNNTKNKFGRDYGKTRLSGSISFLITVFLASILFENYSINYFPILFLSASIIFLINAFQIKKEYEPLKVVKYKNSFKRLISQKEYVSILIICSLLQSSHAMYYSYSSIIWYDKGLSIEEIGLLWSVGVIAEVFLFYKISKININKNYYSLINACCVLTGARWIGTYMVDNFYYLVFIQTLHAVSFGLTHYLMMYFIYKKIPSDLKLISQVCYHGLSSGIILTFLILCLSLYFSYFNDNKGYLLMAMVCILSFFISYFSKRNRKR